jgi:hypothetical protein
MPLSVRIASGKPNSRKVRSKTVKAVASFVEVEGVKPYGHLPGEKVLIARMKALRRKPSKGKRSSVAKIAEQLNAEGHRNRAGREWSAQLVHHVLKSADRLS